jgi:hypothetical protein
MLGVLSLLPKNYVAPNSYDNCQNQKCGDYFFSVYLLSPVNRLDDPAVYISFSKNHQVNQRAALSGYYVLKYVVGYPALRCLVGWLVD